MTLLLVLAAALATLRHIWRGGTAINDHLVGIAVMGTFAVMGMVSVCVARADLSAAWIAAGQVLVVLGCLCQYALFAIADRRKDPGAGPIFWAEAASQPVFAFTFWVAVVQAVRVPVLAALGRWDLFLSPGAWLLVALALAAWSTIWAFGPGVRVRRMEIPCLASGSAPLRIVHLSDLHYAAILPRHRLRRLLSEAMALKPDLVAVTGDLLMPFSEAEHGDLVDTLNGVPVPLVACPGNHDLNVISRLQRELPGLLVDASRVVVAGGRAVEVVGVTFHWRDAVTRLRGALSALPPAPGVDARILLVHDPRLFDAVPLDRFHLVLAGHTHGGLVSLEMLGLPWSLMGVMGHYDKGLFKRENLPLYVHRGNWTLGLPPRLGTAPEIAVLDLVANR